MTGDNLKYGKLITDARYIQQVIKDMQDIINTHKESGEGYFLGEKYSEDGMKGVITDVLDELEIYPEDIDYIFSELEF